MKVTVEVTEAMVVGESESTCIPASSRVLKGPDTFSSLLLQLNRIQLTKQSAVLLMLFLDAFRSAASTVLSCSYSSAESVTDFSTNRISKKGKESVKAGERSLKSTDLTVFLAHLLLVRDPEHEPIQNGSDDDGE